MATITSVQLEISKVINQVLIIKNSKVGVKSLQGQMGNVVNNLQTVYNDVGQLKASDILGDFVLG